MYNYKIYNLLFYLIMFSDDIDLELRLARFEHLMERRLLLLNSVLLRQNPHNVQEWHKRVRLYEGQPHEVQYIFIKASNDSTFYYCNYYFFLFRSLIHIQKLYKLYNHN